MKLTRRSLRPCGWLLVAYSGGERIGFEPFAFRSAALRARDRARRSKLSPTLRYAIAPVYPEARTA